jgi:hypothetical protein
LVTLRGAALQLPRHVTRAGDKPRPPPCAMDHSELLASFMAVTDSSEVVATQMLELTGWQLDEAVQLFFASNLDTDTDAQLARRLASDMGPSTTGGWGADPYEVRPADERYHDTLTGAPQLRAGPVVPPTALLPPLAGGQRDELVARGGLGISPPAQGFLDPFLDVRAAPRAQAAAGPAGPGDAGGDALLGGGIVPVTGRRAARGPDAGLSGMFEPPVDVLYGGTVEQAREAATQLDRWLLVNVQSNTEFGSHRLNRDTWRHEAVHSLLATSFVFLQLYDVAPDGRKFLSNYQLGNEYVPATLPVTLLIDPVTGAKMHTWSGFVDAERFMEEIIPFCDATPSTGAVPHKRHKPAARPPPRMTEDEEIAAAIAASMGVTQDDDAGGPATHPAHAGGDADGNGGTPPDEAMPPVGPAVDPAEVTAAALAFLPAEPEASDAHTCSVALRLPTGMRISRRFPRSAPAACLRAWAVSAVPEAAAGRPFRLAVPGPGGGAIPHVSEAPPGPASFGDVAGPTLEEAGLVNAALNFTWAD